MTRALLSYKDTPKSLLALDGNMNIIDAIEKRTGKIGSAGTRVLLDSAAYSNEAYSPAFRFVDLSVKDAVPVLLACYEATVTQTRPRFPLGVKSIMFMQNILMLYCLDEIKAMPINNMKLSKHERIVLTERIQNL